MVRSCPQTRYFLTVWVIECHKERWVYCVSGGNELVTLVLTSLHFTFHSSFSQHLISAGKFFSKPFILNQLFLPPPGAAPKRCSFRLSSPVSPSPYPYQWTQHYSLLKRVSSVVLSDISVAITAGGSVGIYYSLRNNKSPFQWKEFGNSI